MRALAAVGAFVVTIMLVALVILVGLSNRERDDALARERHSYDIMVITRALDSSMARAEAALGRFVINGDRRTGTLYYDEWKRAGRQLERLASLTADNPGQRALVRQLQTLYDRRGEELAEPATRANFRQGWPALSLFAKAGESETIPRINNILHDIADNERALLGQRSTVATFSVARSNKLSTTLSVLGIILVACAIGLGWLTAQALTARRAARDAAQAEADRAETLEWAVAARTSELIEANARLRAEAKVRIEAEERRAQAEQQLRQVQKMEAVGQLTGGIAHDFNNMLAVILGGLDLAKRRVAQEAAEVSRHIDNAMEGANRAAALTRRLLSFARAEPLLPQGVDPGQLIAGMSDLIDRSIGERIEVRISRAANLWQVWVDAYQLENAILNLAVNARDAMEGEGLLLIEASNETIGAGKVGELAPGDYVRISVTDNGSGMTPAVLERVFEPFFTTKPVGKGTGLGLSQIFGFARQSGGDVLIRSEPGEGTTVSIHLPRHRGEADAGEEATPSAPVTLPRPAVQSAAGQTILLVEDDVRVRSATSDALEELGYRVIACSSAEEAIRMLDERDDIRLIVTDVVMPGMTGPELIQTIGPAYPDLSVLFVTGYVGDAADAERFAGHGVLRKPFTVNALATAVASALSRAAPAKERAA
ncbi:ATP-binding protein [Sphingomonas oleivorans]|uniref:ATP-binding protein n=1 Tax=Sphingomonas oleivorans TaxID=1735121 RepID=UPI001FB01F76|nr:ATP-binding protein [Sphingomonas oleivorans]